LSTLSRLQASRGERAARLWPGTRRVLALPDKSGEEIPDLSAELATSGEYSLRPIQSEMLHEMRRAKGLIAAVGVGHGKTLPSFLAGTVLEAKNALLLVPPSLVNQTTKELAYFRDHFKIPEQVRVLSYGKLSTADGTDLLERMAPDLVVADECHLLRHSSAARTKRILRYFRAHPETMFVGLSGTLTAKSLKDYSHLVELALRNGAPLPLDYMELEAWANCIDVNGVPLRSDFGVVRPLVDMWGEESGETFQRRSRVAFQRRFRASPGVVATEDQSCPASLYMRLDDSLKAPPQIQKMVEDLESSWVTPGGEEIEDIISLFRHRRHLVLGFYMEWDWPGGNPDYVWLKARGEWHANVRRVLTRSVEGRDSPLLVAHYAQDPTCRDTELIRAWESWDAVRERRAPPTRTIWVDPYLVDYLMEKALNSKDPVIIWTQHLAIQEALSRRGILAFGAGDAPEDEKVAKTCVMSIPAHGTGKNLQLWSHNMLADFPSNGATLVQLLGRTHRPGQESDSVYVDFCLPHGSVEEDVHKALEICRYIEDTQGVTTNLNAATWIYSSDT
jgi:hypothetical protein